MLAVIANTTRSPINFRALQGGQWRLVSVPASQSVSTTLDQIDSDGQRYFATGALSLQSGSVGELPGKPPASLPAVQFLDLATATQLFVRRSEWTNSRANQSNSPVVARVDLDGPTGGTSTKLDGIVTRAQEMLNQIIFTTFSGRLEVWQLQTWDGITVENAAGGLVLPDDAHASSNPVIWVMIFGV